MKTVIPKYEPDETLEMTDASIIAALRACVTVKDALIELYSLDVATLHQHINRLINAYYGNDDDDLMESAIESALKYLNGKEKHG